MKCFPQIETTDKRLQTEVQRMLDKEFSDAVLAERDRCVNMLAHAKPQDDSGRDVLARARAVILGAI